MAKWSFSCVDNGGKRQAFTVIASSKQEAEKKAFLRAKKHAAGDIGYSWQCKLVLA